MTTAVKNKPAEKQDEKQEKVETQPRETVVVPTSGVTVDSEGFCWRNVLVRMPEGAIADDLRDPAIWRNTQPDRHKNLRKLDRLFILASDESWYAEAICTFADGKSATLLIQKTGSFRAPDSALFTDGTLQVVWDGKGYGVVRNADGAKIGTESFATEQLAIAALQKTYATVA